MLYATAAAQFLRQTPPTEFREISRYCDLCQTIWTRGLPTRDSSSITGLVLDKSFPQSLHYHGVILKRPRDRQHGDINPDPPATAQLQHAITWKPYGLVPFFGYSILSKSLHRFTHFTLCALRNPLFLSAGIYVIRTRYQVFPYYGISLLLRSIYICIIRL